MELLPHQLDGALWLHGRDHAYLADQPGLGKTRTLLASVPEWHRIAVVCPAVVMPHWFNEMRALRRDVTMLRAHSFQSMVGAKNGPARIAEITKVADTLILDEVHMCANPEAKRTKALLAPRDGLARAGKFTNVLYASGTPQPRHPGNLYPVLCSGAPHLLQQMGVRTYMEWIEETCVYEMRDIPGQKWNRDKRVHVFGAKNAPALHRLLTQPQGGQPAFMLRRLESDAGIELPSLWWQWKRIAVDASIIDMTIKTLPDEIRAKLKRLPHMMANDPEANVVRHALGVAKATAYLDSLIDELTDPIAVIPTVIVAHHQAVMDMIAHALRAAGVSFVRVDGGTPQDERESYRLAFQRGDATVFLGSLGVMQTGITLTRAHRIVIVEFGWTGDSNVQVVKRIHRIGQTHACRAELLVAAGTLEEAVAQQVEKEIAMSSSVIDGGTRPTRDPLLEW